MCDYSLESVASRPAKVGDRLVSGGFVGSITRGFMAENEPNVAVCLLPGTELAFDKGVEFDGRLDFGEPQRLDQKVARFRHINEHRAHMHHDALEFADGRMVLLTHLCERQHATVLQLPADPRADKPAVTITEDAYEPIIR